MEEKVKSPVRDMDKAKESESGSVYANHNLSYRYTNKGYGIAGQNCRVEITIVSDLRFPEIAQEFGKAVAEVSSDLNQKAMSK